MTRNSFVLSVLMLLSIMVISTALVAVPLSVLEDPNNPLSQETPRIGDINLSTDFTGLSGVAYKPGDTAHLLCDVATFSFGTFGGSDCWGWEGPDGTEYAFMGVVDGIAVVNATTLQYIQTIPGPENGCGGARWRDMMSYQHYLYSVSECSGTNQGLIVTDLQYLPDSVHVVGTFPISVPGNYTSHNLCVDTVNGFIYIEGYGATNLSVHILSLANPESPVYLNSFGPSNIHDVYAIRDTVFLAEGTNPSWSMWDLTIKTSPQLLKRVNIPGSGYMHNIWPTPDLNYVVTTEETSNKTVKIWDINDLNNVQLLGQYLASSGLAHNAQLVGDTLYLSHYESGIVEVDISDKNNPVEIGSFDTFASETPNFNGAWGVFPHTSTGRVYGSNMDGTLFILNKMEIALADTMWIDEVVGVPGGLVKVTVSVSNTLPLQKITIPINWAGPLNMTLNSVTRFGTRTDYFLEHDTVVYSPGIGKMAFTLSPSADGSQPDLPPGSGPVMALWFQIPPGAPDTINPVTLNTIITHDAVLSHECITYVPDTISGAVMTGSFCCIGNRGNVDDDSLDDVNVNDLTVLVEYLFKGGPTPACPEEANINGIGSILVDDLTYLVNYLFKSGLIPPACN